MQTLEYLNLPHCLRLSNGDAEVIVSTDIGPRVLRYALEGGENVLAELPEMSVTTALGHWNPRGGHRLWIAPEIMPGSYAPDNGPLEHEILGPLSVRLKQRVDATHFEKEMTIALEPSGSGVTVHHKITNRSSFAVQVAPWALTIVRSGTVLLPQEPYKSHADELLPARALVLWPFTDLSDPRWIFGPRFIRLKADPNLPQAQKIGAMNKQGYLAHHSSDTLFIKRFDFLEGHTYPDYGSNCEAYVEGAFQEVESLGPLKVILPDESLEHVEKWTLHADFKLSQSDDELEAALIKLL
ncbi:MAG: hypothetical protein H7095_06795 [Pseudopedobacter sp.]|nr:hypothetical protein [Deinococcales bacterium]